jgi:hypothetical protein
MSPRAIIALGAATAASILVAPPQTGPGPAPPRRTESAPVTTPEISTIYSHPLDNDPGVQRASSLLRRALEAFAPRALPTRPRPAFEPRDVIGVVRCSTLSPFRFSSCLPANCSPAS